MPLWEIKIKFGNTRGWLVFVELLSCSLTVIRRRTSSPFWLFFKECFAPGESKESSVIEDNGDFFPILCQQGA